MHLAPLLLSLTVLAALPTAGRAQYRTGTGAVPARAASMFRFETSAKAELQALWRASTEARVEKVACLGGRIEGDRVVITRVLPLESEGADSTGVSARESIERCGPGDFRGTVHTHIVEADGESPYPSFSGADRGVMHLWWRRWQVDGIFCVLYSKEDAHCEVYGVVAPVRFSPPAAY